MAIEDAVVLAHSLKVAGSLPEALEIYERRRVPPTTRIVDASLKFGKLAQLENPLGIWLRNTIVRLTPASVVKRQLRQGAAFSL